MKQGDRVSKGQELIRFDMEAIKKKGYDVTTIMVVTNSQSYDKVAIDEYRFVKGSDRVMKVNMA